MLMPRRLGGSLGARDGLFRVLLCRIGRPEWCGAVWTANDSHELIDMVDERVVHESLCATGVFEDVPEA